LRDLRRCSLCRWFPDNLQHRNNRNKEIFKQTFAYVKRDALASGWKITWMETNQVWFSFFTHVRGVHIEQFLTSRRTKRQNCNLPYSGWGIGLMRGCFSSFDVRKANESFSVTQVSHLVV
jgi:hypothetical protein